MKLLEKIDEKDLGAVVSSWTGNDDSNRVNSCRVNVTKVRDLVLHWRKSKLEKPILVGYFRMYPENLIREGYCTEEDGKIRVNLYHSRDGRITLSLERDDKKALLVGKIVSG